MEAFSDETLTILVLIAVVLSSVTFIAVSILIIGLLRIQYRRRPTVVSPMDSYSSDRRSSVSSTSTISSPTVPIKSPVIRSTKRQEQRSPSNSISIIEERSYDNRKKHSQIYNHDETTIKSESRVHSQRQQQKPMTDMRFMDRSTPYPPDVIARERIMMTHLRIPKNNKH
jgi:hypothetical protein